MRTAAVDRLEALEAGFSPSVAPTGSSRWMIPYADLLTLLLGVFLVLLSPTLPQAKEPQAQAGKDLTPALSLRGARVKTPPAASRVEKQDWQQTNHALQTQLTQALEGIPQAETRQEARGIVITLPDNLLFQPGDATLNPGAQAVLARLAASLRDIPRPFAVEGHTDDVPVATERYPSNWELSTARAGQVLRYLVEQQGLPAQRISASGYGSLHPVANNSTIEGKQKNRRVDIVVMNRWIQRTATAPKTPSRFGYRAVADIPSLVSEDVEER